MFCLTNSEQLLARENPWLLLGSLLVDLVDFASMCLVEPKTLGRIYFMTVMVDPTLIVCVIPCHDILLKIASSMMATTYFGKISGSNANLVEW